MVLLCCCCDVVVILLAFVCVCDRARVTARLCARGRLCVHAHVCALLRACLCACAHVRKNGVGGDNSSRSYYERIQVKRVTRCCNGCYA